MESAALLRTRLEGLAWEAEKLLRQRGFAALREQPGQSAVADMRHGPEEGTLLLHLSWQSPRQERFWAHFTYRVGEAWAEFGMQASLGRFHDGTGYWRVTSAEQVTFLLDNWVTLAQAREGPPADKPPAG